MRISNIVRFDDLPIGLQAKFSNVKKSEKVEFIRIVTAMKEEIYYTRYMDDILRWKYVNGSWQQED